MPKSRKWDRLIHTSQVMKGRKSLAPKYRSGLKHRDGNTYIYLADMDGNIYSARYESVIEMMLVEEGDTITILTDGKDFAYPAK